MPKVRRNKDNSSSDTTGAAAAFDPGTLDTDARANGDSRERIAARAYELYLARGGTDGQDWDDWLAAERELAEHLRPGEPAE